MTGSSSPRYTTATLAKGLEVLEALAEVDSIGLSDLARRLQIAVPTLFRILATLVERGFAQKAEGRYRLTLKSWELGARVLARFDVARVARPWIARLAVEVDESPHLAVLRDEAVVIVERGECRQAVKVETLVGLRAPAHASATGKVLLAYQPASRLAELLAAPLPRYSDRTLTEPEALRRELAKVRRQGYATNRGEWRPGVCAVAVPLADASGGVVAALSLTLPTERFGEARLKNVLLPALRRTAAGIAGDLGVPA
jgi:IclR family KDG regulon transcriptional repressor